MVAWLVEKGVDRTQRDRMGKHHSIYAADRRQNRKLRALLTPALKSRPVVGGAKNREDDAKRNVASPSTVVQWFT